MRSQLFVLIVIAAEVWELLDSRLRSYANVKSVSFIYLLIDMPIACEFWSRYARSIMNTPSCKTDLLARAIRSSVFHLAEGSFQDDILGATKSRGQLTLHGFTSMRFSLDFRDTMPTMDSKICVIESDSDQNNRRNSSVKLWYRLVITVARPLTIPGRYVQISYHSDLELHLQQPRTS
jgi:hypothetical protein